MPSRVVRLAASGPEVQAGLDRIRADLEVPEHFPADTTEAAEAAARQGTVTGTERFDARDLPFVTIDPPGTRDLDQAYFAARQGRLVRVMYAIADVAGFVQPDDPVDREAFARGVTRYLPDRRAPLYPDVIGEGAASLLPEVERPALLWTIELDADGAAKTWRLERALVRSRGALTYAAAERAIERGDADEPLALLREIGRLRQEQERRRGGVSVAVPTQEVTRVKDDYRLAYDEPLAVEGWNAQVSLLAGMCAASTMIDGGIGVLRTLPVPEARVVERLRRSALTLGIDWPEGRTYADIVHALTPSDSAHAAFLTQAVAVLRGAGYQLVGAGSGPPPVHSALAAPYAHVTAPLRRLADRFANEVVLALCAQHAPPAWATDALPALPDAMQAGARRAGAVERAVVDLVEALVLRTHVGEEFQGAVVDLEGTRATVQLTRPAVIATIGSAGLRLGDDVTVRLNAAIPETRTVEFALA